MWWPLFFALGGTAILCLTGGLMAHLGWWLAGRALPRPPGTAAPSMPARRPSVPPSVAYFESPAGSLVPAWADDTAALPAAWVTRSPRGPQPERKAR